MTQVQELTESADPPAPQQQPARAYETALLFDQEGGQTLSPPKRQPIVVSSSLAKIFVRAAGINRSGSEPPLTFSTLLVALLVDEDSWLKTHFETQQVRFDEIARRRPYDEVSLRDLAESEIEPEYLTTISARAALEEAARIARRTTIDGTIDRRHLCAAYPILSKWHESDFETFRIDRLEWARAFGAQMAQQFPSERAYWGSYADRASPVPLTSFSADVYTEDDLLGIDRSVDALALLIASTRTVTPLAIGIFGPWGSGKTFFMRHLQKRIVGIRRTEQRRIKAWVAARSAGTARPEDAPLYFGEIAQVEFNAWHYNEGNLVASLVEHLFRNLRVLPDEGDEQLAERRADMLRKLKVLNSELLTVDQTITAAQRNVAEAKVSVEIARTEAETAKNDVREMASNIESRNEALVAVRQQLDWEIQAIELKSTEVDPEDVIAVALGPLAPLVAEVRETIGTLRDQAFDWREFLSRVLSAKGLVVVSLCLIAPFMLKLAGVLQAQWGALLSSVVAAAAGFGSAFDVLKRRRAEFESKLADLEVRQQQSFDAARAAITAQRNKQIAAAQLELDTLKGTLEARRKALAEQEKQVSNAAHELARRAEVHDSRLAERVAAEQRAREAEAELERLSSALLLEEFIKDRSSTDDYRKQLGFLALVRRDIEQLSKLIENANKSWLEKGSKDPPPLLNRIVLYIDDLDRCKEATVLAVLEAVHLLLAFPLFVCAVAVDPRWVEKCLRATHKQLFAEEDQPLPEIAGEDPVNHHQVASGVTRSSGRLSAPATVGDYLEKIFQIPIWMSPIAAPIRATLVNSLLGPTAAPPPRGTATEGQRGRANVSDDHGEDEDNGDTGGFVNIAAKARETPDPLRISDEEANFVTEICELLSERPRALKRFVNVYRLLKASLPDLERASFVNASPSSPHRVCLSQLAFFTSHPRLASSLVAAVGNPKEVTEGSAGARATADLTLAEWLNGLDLETRNELQGALELFPNREAMLLDPFRRWLPLTSRYLFHRAD
ncbi:MAG: P-loop NTPase fold protein [Gemmatimonadaceae bacterium]